MIDLHVHSTASDGIYTPSQLVNLAAENGVSVLALTDHDTFSGVQEAALASQKAGITFVPGIELNISWPTGEFHLLGLGIHNPSPLLNEIVNNLQKDREKRNKTIIESMQNQGFDVSYEELKQSAGGECIGRPHIAAYMVEKKIVRHRQDAFDKYLAKGMPWYVPHTGAELDEAIVAINESGGVPVIAHPLSLYVSWGKIEGVLSDLHERGVEGLEAWHPGARVVDCSRLEEYARKLGFFVTAGSDFHGEAVRADRKLGRTAGKEKIDDRFWLEELKPVLDKRSASVHL